MVENSSLANRFYRRFILPELFKLDPEEAHAAAHHAFGLLSCVPKAREVVSRALTVNDSRLVQTWSGITFANPVGLAAGFDKNATTMDGLEALGFGFLEVGTVTRDAQPGNPRPRLFRLADEEALINRMGFNGDGADAVAARLERTKKPSVPLFVNVGLSRNVSSEDSSAVWDDYGYTIKRVYPYADALTINVSSPNTPGLRELQKREYLQELILRAVLIRSSLSFRAGEPHKPIFLKIAPDIDEETIDGIVEALQKCVETGGKSLGLIVSNTTVRREGERTPLKSEQGGLSGQPLKRMANELLVKFRKRLPHMFMIGVGGIQTAEDAIERLRAGANLIQLYTGLIYQGPTIVRDLNEGILDELDRLGMWSLDAFGDWRHYSAFAM